MGICKDKYVTFLNGFGYNIVRLPRTGIGPLLMLGRQTGTTTLIGDIKLLLDGSKRPRPIVEENLDAAPVKGQQSSSLDLALGLNILGTFIGAFGGNLGVKSAYKGARAITFQFDDVLLDRVLPGDIGEYLKEGDLNAENIVLQEYVLGNGDLFVITEVLKSRSFSVTASKKDGGELALEVPEVQGAVGGNVKVSASSQSKSTLTYAGANYLTFGFQCYHVGVENGRLSLVAHKPGEATALSLAAPESGNGAVLLKPSGLMVIAP